MVGYSSAGAGQYLPIYSTRHYCPMETTWRCDVTSGALSQVGSRGSTHLVSRYGVEVMILRSPGKCFGPSYCRYSHASEVSLYKLLRSSLGTAHRDSQLSSLSCMLVSEDIETDISMLSTEILYTIPARSKPLYAGIAEYRYQSITLRH